VMKTVMLYCIIVASEEEASVAQTTAAQAASTLAVTSCAWITSSHDQGTSAVPGAMRCRSISKGA
jgi:hypothetical protein